VQSTGQSTGHSHHGAPVRLGFGPSGALRRPFTRAFLDAAGSGRQADLQGFLNALDKAAYAQARRPGKRLLLVILDSPAPETVKAMRGGQEELESRFSLTVDFCQSKAEMVVVLDPSEPASKGPLAALTGDGAPAKRRSGGFSGKGDQKSEFPYRRRFATPASMPGSTRRA
jgi:hypothetical protein